MSLGIFTIVEQVASDGPLFIDRCTLVGDGTYPAGGTPDFEALYQAAAVAAGLKNAGGRTIVMLHQDHDTELSALEYDHANDKLFARVKTTGVESAVTNQSGITYVLTIVSK